MSTKTGDVSTIEAIAFSPVESAKVGALVKALMHWGFIANLESRVVVTVAGREFARSSEPVRSAFFSNWLNDLPMVSQIIQIIKQTPKHWISKDSVTDCLSLACRHRVDPSCVERFLEFAEASELLTYNRQSGEISMFSAEIVRSKVVNCVQVVQKISQGFHSPKPLF